MLGRTRQQKLYARAQDEGGADMAGAHGQICADFLGERANNLRFLLKLVILLQTERQVAW